MRGLSRSNKFERKKISIVATLKQNCERVIFLSLLLLKYIYVSKLKRNCILFWYSNNLFAIYY